MSVIRPVLLTVLFFCAVPLQAAFEQPACTALEQWASGLDTDRPVTVAPRIEMPSLLQDKSLVSLFRRPILGWSKQQFRDVDAHLNRCRKQASQRGDREAASALKAVRAEIERVAYLARDYRQALHRVEQAIQQLDVQPPSEALARAMDLAIDALQRKPIRKEARGLPDEQQRALQEIVMGADYLSEAAASRFAGRLQKLQGEVSRKAEKQAAEARALRAESQMTPEERQVALERAREELKEAQARIDAASADNDGLILLEGMIELPPLRRVPADERQAFLDHLYARHDELNRALRQAREAETQRLVQERLDRLYAMRADRLGDLGRLFAYRDSVHQAMRPPGQRQAAQAFEEGFERYLEQVAARLKPDFMAALEAIPADPSGLAKLDTAVPALTGIPDQTPYLDSYYALVEKRRAEVSKTIAR